MIVEGNYTFGLLKQNLSVDQRVVMGRTTDPLLDGKTGIILGKSSEHPQCDFYIILLDEPAHGQKGISLIESCICPIS